MAYTGSVGTFIGSAAINLLELLLRFLVFYAIAYLFSSNRKLVSFKLLLLGVFWQIVFAMILLKIPAITFMFQKVNDGLQVITSSTAKGVAFCFGGLASPPASSGLGFILAFQGFPVLIVISALSSLLIYWRILPTIIKILSIFYRKAFCIGGTLGIAVSANMFTGMSETPLVIKPYLSKLNHSELFTLMVCGTSGIASSVIALYSSIVGAIVPNALSHIISAILINIPAALTLARIMVPPTEKAHLTEGDDIGLVTAKSTLDAIYTGIMDGAKVIITIIAMIIGFISLVDITNQILTLLPSVEGEALSMQRMLGWLMSPVAMLIGIPWEEARTAGSIIGAKIIMNEVIGFQELVSSAAILSDSTKIIMIYAICGFANLGSVGIMIGIYGALVPERRQEVISLGMRSILAGAIANCLTATLVGVVLRM